MVMIQTRFDIKDEVYTQFGANPLYGEIRLVKIADVKIQHGEIYYELEGGVSVPEKELFSKAEMIDRIRTNIETQVTDLQYALVEKLAEIETAVLKTEFERKANA